MPASRSTTLVEWFVLSIAIIFTTSAQSDEDCSSVISLSKVRSSVVSSRSEVESNATAFCNQYSHQQGSSASANFGASYKFLAATFANNTASVDEVASKYCSSTKNYAASDQAYSNYIESIAPGAYGAYQSCIELAKSNLHFGITEATVLPKEFTLSVSFGAPGNSVAELDATGSDGVSCQWNGGSGTTVDLESPGTRNLTCKRINSAERSYVKVVQTNGDKQFTVPWQAYTTDGIPVNLLNDVMGELKKTAQQLDELKGKLDREHQEVNVTFVPITEKCPSDWADYGNIQFTLDGANQGVNDNILTARQIPFIQPPATTQIDQWYWVQTKLCYRK